jgi:hypothetical protein
MHTKKNPPKNKKKQRLEQERQQSEQQRTLTLHPQVFGLFYFLIYVSIYYLRQQSEQQRTYTLHPQFFFLNRIQYIYMYIYTHGNSQ